MVVTGLQIVSTIVIFSCPNTIYGCGYNVSVHPRGPPSLHVARVFYVQAPVAQVPLHAWSRHLCRVARVFCVQAPAA
jgi:hypothetical protein